MEEIIQSSCEECFPIIGDFGSGEKMRHEDNHDVDIGSFPFKVSEHKAE